MNDPQVWTLIGVFAAAILGGMSFMTSQLSRVMRAEVDRIDATLSSRIDAVSTRIDAVSARIDNVDARLGRIETKVDELDRELTNLATRFWRSQ